MGNGDLKTAHRFVRDERSLPSQIGGGDRSAMVFGWARGINYSPEPALQENFGSLIQSFGVNGASWKINTKITYPASQKLFQSLVANLKQIFRDEEYKELVEGLTAEGKDLTPGQSFVAAVREIGSTNSDVPKALKDLKNAALAELNQNKIGANVLKLITVRGSDAAFYNQVRSHVVLPAHEPYVSPVRGQASIGGGSAADPYRELSPTTARKFSGKSTIATGPSNSSAKAQAPAASPRPTPGAVGVNTDVVKASEKGQPNLKVDANSTPETNAQKINSSNPVVRYTTLSNALRSTLQAAGEKSQQPKNVTPDTVTNKQNPVFAFAMEGFKTIALSATSGPYGLGAGATEDTTETNPLLAGAQRGRGLGGEYSASQMGGGLGGPWSRRGHDMTDLIQTYGTVFPGRNYALAFTGLQAFFNAFGAFADTRAINNSSNNKSRVEDVGSELREFGKNLLRVTTYLSNAQNFSEASQRFHSRGNGLNLNKKLHELSRAYVGIADPTFSLRTKEEQEERLGSKDDMRITLGWLVQLHNSGKDSTTVLGAAKKLSSLIKEYSHDLNVVIDAITDGNPKAITSIKVP